MISLFLLLTSAVSGHNWVNSPSRAAFGGLASTEKPSVESATGGVNVQVVAGQQFQIEWVQGHPSAQMDKFHYFTILSARNEARMALHGPTMYQDYMKGCAGAEARPPIKPWQASVYKYNDMTLDMLENCTPPQKEKNQCPQKITNFFQSRITSGSSHIPRPEEFDGRIAGAPALPKLRSRYDITKVGQFEYKNAQRVNNRRCTHRSSKYPWVVEMARFQVVKHRPANPNVAWFQIPEGSPAGKYIVHWSWRGYYDAVDVLVVNQPTPIAAPFGAVDASKPDIFNRIDHCDYPANTRVGRCRYMKGPTMPLPTDCMNDCLGNAECKGVLVAPVVHPSSVYRPFRTGPGKVDVNIPFGSSGNGGCARPTDNTMTHACYALISREPTDVDGEFFTTKDPEDPVFYSTCFKRLSDNGLGSGTIPAIQWEFRGKCISCAERTINARSTVTPIWAIQDTCRDCAISTSLRLWLRFTGDRVRNLAFFGYNAEIKGKITYMAGAKTNYRAAVFPGTVDSYLDLGTAQFATGRISIMAWVRPENVDSNPVIFAKSTSLAAADTTMSLAITTGTGAQEGKRQFYARLQLEEGVTTTVRCNKPIVNNAWQHVGVVYDKVNMVVYFNGVECGKTARTTNIVSSNARANIGREPSGRSAFKGRLSDFRIYATSLSARSMKGVGNR